MSKSPLDAPNTLTRVNTRPPTDDKKLRNATFAGRIGGNQQFTVSRDDPEYEKIKSETPDAITDVTWSEMCGLRGFREPEIWRSALIELWGTLGPIDKLNSACNNVTRLIVSPSVSGLNAFTSGAVGIALGNLHMSVYKSFPCTTYNLEIYTNVIPRSVTSPVVASAIGGIMAALTLPLYIFAAAPASGGHLNPMITMATFATRLSTLPRTVVYVVAQVTGATIGGYLLRAGVGDKIVVSVSNSCSDIHYL